MNLPRQTPIIEVSEDLDSGKYFERKLFDWAEIDEESQLPVFEKFTEFLEELERYRSTKDELFLKQG